MTQKEALQILQTGANVFLTGSPGAGKTYVINRYVEWLRERGIEPAITASTGIAATHIGGMTIHAWSGVGIKRDLSDWDLEAMHERESLVKRVRSAHVLIIDEISMLDARLLSLVDLAASSLRHSERPFGGLQVVFVGDFFQLPPINKNRSEEGMFSGNASEFAFTSSSWERANPLVCYITEQHRQDDDAFLELLGALRAGTLEARHRQVLKARATVAQEGEVTQLFPHNADVDRINSDALDRLPSSARVFKMSSQGSKPLIEALKRGCLSPELLQLKEGAAVMFTRNNFERGYVNGTLGTVEGWSVTGMPLVRLSSFSGAGSGDLIEADVEEWRVEDGKRVLAKITQVPLRLAWAITVHKAQGMSLDAAVMDLSQAFEYGQGYVALSRVRTLAGLYLSGFNDRALEVHPEILEKDTEFRETSEKVAELFSKMPAEELSDMQKNFVKAIGGKEPEVVKEEREKTEEKNRLENPEGKSKLEKMREKHPNAYKPWSREDDDRLTVLFRENRTVSELIKEFGRHKGAIQSRLIRLGLVEPEL